MGKIKNKEILKDLNEKMAKAKGITIADYSGLKANDLNDLRQKMNQADAELIVAKNTLFKLSVEQNKIAGDDFSKVSVDLDGPTAVILSYNDIVAPIKELFAYIKKLELPKIKSAIFDGKYATAEEVEKISTLPSKEQLIAQFVGGLKSPLNSIVGALSGVQRKFVYALSAIKDKKGGVN